MQSIKQMTKGEKFDTQPKIQSNTLRKESNKKHKETAKHLLFPFFEMKQKK